MAKDTRQRFNVFIDRDLLKRLRMAAAERGTSMAELTDKALRMYLANRRKQQEEVTANG